MLVTAITGGNPDLLADRRNVFKLGGNWQPSRRLDLRLRADYVRSRLDRPVSSFPRDPRRLEAAFPERFVRDALPGQLVSVDLRPVNFDEARRDTLRWGFDFTKPLQSARPSQALIDQMRAQFGCGPRGAGQGRRYAARTARPTARGARRPKAARRRRPRFRRRRRRLWRRLRRRQPGRPADLLADPHHQPSSTR